MVRKSEDNTSGTKVFTKRLSFTPVPIRCYSLILNYCFVVGGESAKFSQGFVNEQRNKILKKRNITWTLKALNKLHCNKFLSGIKL